MKEVIVLPQEITDAMEKLAEHLSKTILVTEFIEEKFKTTLSDEDFEKLLDIIVQ